MSIIDKLADPEFNWSAPNPIWKEDTEEAVKRYSASAVDAVIL